MILNYLYRNLNYFYKCKSNIKIMQTRNFTFSTGIIKTMNYTGRQRQIFLKNFKFNSNVINENLNQSSN